MTLVHYGLGKDNQKDKILKWAKLIVDDDILCPKYFSLWMYKLVCTECAVQQKLDSLCLQTQT